MSTRPFIVYKASAGSGKTYTLVKEYLKMAFSLGAGRLEEGFRTILAITFTKKATGEMKERILDDLARIAREPPVPGAGGIAADVLDALNADGIKVSPEQLQQMASKLRSTMLHHYSDLSVSTIDSFMHSIVRTFAHDMGQPMNFDVMIDQQKMIDEAVAQLMSLAGTEGEQELTEVLQAFAESRMDDDKGYNVEHLIEELAKQLFREDVGDRLRQLAELDLGDFKVIQQRYAKEIRMFEAAVKVKGAEMLDLLHSAGLTRDTAPYGMSGYYGYFCKLAAGTIADPSPRTVTAFESGKMTAAKSPQPLAAAVTSMMPQLTAKYEEIKTLLGDGMVRYNTCRTLLRNLYTVALLGQLDRQMRLYARDNEVVHLSDFNKLINAVVEDEDNPAPFFYERLGNRYRHFLVDEFQDTSIMQWHNLVPLLENGVSQGKESLVVGDGKQSIYRFRQGDVQQFVRLPKVEGMKHHGQTLSLPGNSSVESLQQNRRSAVSIVNFNNSLFNYLAREVYTDNPLVQSIYIGRDANGDLLPEGKEELHQDIYKKIEGHVEVNFVAKADAEEGGFENVKSAIYDGVLQTIRRLTTRSGYAYKDIVVLARSNAELASIGSYLSQHSDIPQTSTESFYLTESHAVMAVVAVLRLLHNGADRSAEADLMFRLTALGLAGGQWDGVFDNWAAAPHTTDAERMPAGLNMPYLASLDLYDCCEEIVRRLHLDGIDTLYVASLLDNVASFAARHRQDVGEFLEWFDEQKHLSASSSEEIDAVQMLTIHKAKGLGKPVVICPLFYGKEYPPELWVDVPDEMKGSDGTPSLPTAFVTLNPKERTLFESQRQQEQLLSEVDELNVLYVAFTRPKEQLYVFCPDPSDIKTPRDHDRRYPTLLYGFVNSKGFDGGDINFMHPADKDEKPPKRQECVARMNYDDWTERVLIASPSEKAITPLQESKIRFGVYAHDLMAEVEHAGDVEAAVERFRARGVADVDEMESLANLARRVVNDEGAGRFFDPQYEVKNECELVSDGRRGRPDRVVFAGDETWVVDFKTGERLDEHEEQVRGYCKAMREMGYPNVSGWLLYLQPEVEVVKVMG